MTGTGDIRVNDPSGTSIYEALTFKKRATDNTNNLDETKTNLSNNDNKTVSSSTKVPDKTNLDFVDKNQQVNSVPLRDANTGKILKMITDEKGFPILDENGQLQFDDVNGKPVYVKADAQGNPILDEEGNFQVVESVGKVPTNSISFSDDDLPPLLEVQKTEAKENKANNTGIELSLPLLNAETGEVLKFKVDDKGKPILDDKGNPIQDPNGKPLFVKVNENGEPILDKNGQFIFVQEQKHKLPQSANKVIAGIYSYGIKKGISKISTGLVKGASVSIPFTSKTIGFGTKHAVQKALTQELAKLTTAKTGSTTIVKSLEKAGVEATEGAIKTLTEAGKLGKGTQTLSRATFGKWYQPSAYTQLVKESANGLVKTTKAVAKGGSKAATEVVKKTVIGSSEKILQKGMQEGIESAVKTVIKKGGSEIAEQVATKGTQKALTVVAEKAAVKAATTGTAKVGSKLAGAIPIVGGAINAGITAWDIKDAIEKSKDPNVSKASKALAWTTVGLDVVSTFAVSTGIGAPIGWIASGLSIGTSILSDYLR
ncbi:MAG: hypothetical protein KatS3mg068_2122 [Candidatus Sericytochromatia bacterium]|nr:MAG: hypothetical protein KatS3mg068_2122 [Candidatus Sericytochromatia bacterium]